MCGILGYKSDGPLSAQAVNFIEALLVRSKMRGLHATGIAYLGDNGLTVYKEPVPANKFIEAARWQAVMKCAPLKAILHTRYSTSGDWLDNENNQPLVHDGCVLVHNGVVSMAEKNKFEAKYQVTCQTANDSDVILSKIIEHRDAGHSDRESIRRAMQVIHSVEPPIYACGLLTATDKVYCWRDDVRPLYMFGISALGLTGFCSTGDIFRQAATTARLEGVCHPCTPGVIYEI